MERLDSSPVCATDIKKQTSHDPVLSNVLQFILTGWSDICDSDNLKPFWSKQLELSAQQSYLLWGNRVVVSSSLHQKILQQLHDSHLRISQMRSLGRMFVWWPGFDQ